MFYYVKNRVEKIAHMSACFHLRMADFDNLEGFKTLTEVHGRGYRLCKHCDPVRRQYRREQAEIEDFCRKSGVSVWTRESYIGILTPYSKWKLLIDENNTGLVLYHRNTHDLRTTPGDVEGYHLQGDIKKDSVLGYLDYVVEHDRFRLWNPLRPKPQPKTEKAPPRKGTHRYKNQQKQAKLIAKKQAIRNVLTLIEDLQAQRACAMA